MSTSIGRAALVLTTNYADMVGGLGKAKEKAVGWASSTASAVGSALKTFGSGALFGAGMKAFDALTASIADPLERLDELAKTASTARTFGIDPSEFSAISGVLKSVGSDLRDQTESLITMSTLGRNAAAGTQEAAAAFKSLNLNAAEFNNLGVVDQFYAAYDALSKMSDPKLRNSAAGKLFGEDGMKNVVPLIGKSADEIKRMGESFRKSNGDLAAAELANKKLKEAQLTVAAAWDRIIIAAAPGVQLLAEQVPAGVRAAEKVFGGFETSVMPILRGTAVGIGHVGDAVQGWWDLMKASIGGVIELAGHATEAIDKLTGGTGDMGRAMQEVGGEMAKAGVEGLFNYGQNAAAAREFFDAWKADRDKALTAPLPAAAAVTVPAKLDVQDVKYSYQANNALVAGTREELSARIRAEVGASSVQERQLAEQRTANGLLKDVAGGVKAVAVELAGLGFGVI